MSPFKCILFVQIKMRLSLLQYLNQSIDLWIEIIDSVPSNDVDSYNFAFPNPDPCSKNQNNEKPTS